MADMIHSTIDGDAGVLTCTTCGARLSVSPDGDVGICPACGNKYIVSLAKRLSDKPVSETEQLTNMRTMLTEAVARNDIASISEITLRLLTLIPDDYTATYYWCYSQSAKGMHDYIVKFYRQRPELYTDEEIQGIAAHICEYSELRDRALIEAYFMNFERADYAERYRAEYNRRKKIEENYDDVPRDVFVCHRSTDIAVVERVVAALERDSHTCWTSYRNLRPNDIENYNKNIDRAIRSCTLFLVITSEDAMQSADVKREMSVAINEGKPRLEYKIDNSAHTNFFKNFFDGVTWVDGYTRDGKEISRLCQRVFLELEAIRHSGEDSDAPVTKDDLRSLREMLERQQEAARNPDVSVAENHKKENLFKLIEIAIVDEHNFRSAEVMLQEMIHNIDAGDYRCWWYSLLVEYRRCTVEELATVPDYTDSKNYRALVRSAGNTAEGTELLGRLQAARFAYLRSTAAPIEAEVATLAAQAEPTLYDIRTLERKIQELPSYVVEVLDAEYCRVTITDAYARYYRNVALQLNEDIRCALEREVVTEEELSAFHDRRMQLDKQSLPYLIENYDEQMEALFVKCYSHAAQVYNEALNELKAKESVEREDIDRLRKMRDALPANSVRYVTSEESEIIKAAYNRYYATEADKINASLKKLVEKPVQDIGRIDEFVAYVAAQSRQVQARLDPSRESIISRAYQASGAKVARDINRRLNGLKRTRTPQMSEIRELSAEINKYKKRDIVISKINKNYVNILSSAESAAKKATERSDVRSLTAGNAGRAIALMLGVLVYTTLNVLLLVATFENKLPLWIPSVVSYTLNAAVFFISIFGKRPNKLRKVRLVQPSLQLATVYFTVVLCSLVPFALMQTCDMRRAVYWVYIFLAMEQYLMLTVKVCKFARYPLYFGNQAIKSTGRILQIYSIYAIFVQVSLYQYVYLGKWQPVWLILTMIAMSIWSIVEVVKTNSYYTKTYFELHEKKGGATAPVFSTGKVSKR